METLKFLINNFNNSANVLFRDREQMTIYEGSLGELPVKYVRNTIVKYCEYAPLINAFVIEIERI